MWRPEKAVRSQAQLDSKSIYQDLFKSSSTVGILSAHCVTGKIALNKYSEKFPHMNCVTARIIIQTCYKFRSFHEKRHTIHSKLAFYKRVHVTQIERV